MKTTNPPHLSGTDQTSLLTKMFVGAAIGLAIISFFVFNAEAPKPEWGSLWRVKPLLVTPLAGAACGFFLFAMEYIGARRGWRKSVIYGISLPVFVIGLWIGIILGLDGTMWN